MVNVGIIGLGFIGRMHLATLRKGGLGRVVAVADKVAANLTGGSATAGNIALEGDTSLDGVATYPDGDELLRDPNVEAVLIALPTYLHREYVLKAVAAGKHVLCEKPLALTVGEAREMVEALRGYDRAFMAAQCIRFWPAYAKAHDRIREGAYGKVLSASFSRQSPKPTWSWQGWLHDERRSGGGILDLHIHDVDFVQYAFGRPEKILATGYGLPGEGFGQVNSLYSYANGLSVALDGGWLHPSTFPFRMSFRIEFERATVEFDTRTDGRLRIHTADGRDEAPELSGDGYSVEQEYFLRCVERGVKPTMAGVESALESVALVEVERAAIAGGGAVRAAQAGTFA